MEHISAQMLRPQPGPTYIVSQIDSMLLQKPDGLL